MAPNRSSLEVLPSSMNTYRHPKLPSLHPLLEVTDELPVRDHSQLLDLSHSQDILHEVVQNRFPPYREEGLRPVSCERIHAGGVACGEYNGPHITQAPSAVPHRKVAKPSLLSG